MKNKRSLCAASLLFCLYAPWTAAENLPDQSSGNDTVQTAAENPSAADGNAASAVQAADSSVDEPKDSLPWWRKIFPKEEKPRTPAVPVRIDCDNDTVTDLVQKHLPLIQQQYQEDLDREQIAFLAEEAVQQIQTILQTQGYFNGQVNVAEEGSGYVVHIETGPRTHIDNVSVALTGSITGDDNLTEYYKNAMENWALPVHNPFTQSDWSSSKSSVMQALTRKKYPLAAITDSRALVDPAKNTADLSLVVDSKQPVYFGDIDISGTERYPKDVALGMARFAPGDAYDEDKLLDYQQALEQDGHYGSAVVQPDFANMQNDRVPVKVKVSEMKRQKFEIAVRHDSEDGPGLRVGYNHYNLFNRGYIGSTLLDIDKYETAFSFGLSQPRQSNGHYWTSSVGFNRSTTQNLEKKALTGGVWYVRDKNNIDSRIGLEYITESSRIPNSNTDLGHSNALMLTASWKRQNIESQLRPANGYYLEGKIGTTLGTLMSSANIQRVFASAAYYYTPEERQYGTWIMRGQFGMVHANDDASVPTSLMFRTGGATSVRGYEQDSIGIQANGAVLPDRILGVAGIEYQVPVSKNVSAAVFHDMGSVSHTLSSVKWEHGTGVGIRWFSPVAPFAFDIAYGHHDKKWRWHINLGTRF